jgi:magnesium transporter
MPESLSYASKKSGLPPGSLVHVGEVHEHEHKITVISYNPETIIRHTLKSIDEIRSYRSDNSITWVIIEGLREISTVDAIGRHFEIHGLVQEDILNTHQRPKFEEFENYLYIVLKALALGKNKLNVDYEQVSLIVMKDFVFTFKEKPDAIFNPIIERLDNEKSHLRKFGSDYLAYVILDTIVDEYFALQDAFDEYIEIIEDELLNNPTPRILTTIQKIKRELIFLRRSVAPLRELLKNIERSESILLDERTKRYFGDVYDHSLRISEAMESYRDLIAGMLDIYLSSVSNKMNETMKVLTVFASIFIPLTFIAGVYGMNFEYMPELGWKWAYPTLWLVFIAISMLLLRYFKRKHWL